MPITLKQCVLHVFVAEGVVVEGEVGMFVDCSCLLVDVVVDEEVGMFIDCPYLFVDVVTVALRISVLF